MIYQSHQNSKGTTFLRDVLVGLASGEVDLLSREKTDTSSALVPTIVKKYTGPFKRWKQNLEVGGAGWELAGWRGFDCILEMQLYIGSLSYSFC